MSAENGVVPVLFDLDDTLLDDRGAQDVYLAHLQPMSRREFFSASS